MFDRYMQIILNSVGLGLGLGLDTNCCLFLTNAEYAESVYSVTCVCLLISICSICGKWVDRCMPMLNSESVLR